MPKKPNLTCTCRPGGNSSYGCFIHGTYTPPKQKRKKRIKTVRVSKLAQQIAEIIGWDKTSQHPVDSMMLENALKIEKLVGPTLLDSARLSFLDTLLHDTHGFRFVAEWDNSQDVVSIHNGLGTQLSSVMMSSDTEEEDPDGQTFRKAIDIARKKKRKSANRPAKG